MLYQMALFSVTLSDLTLPQTTQFRIFCIAFRICVAGKDRDFKFGRLVDRRSTC